MAEEQRWRPFDNAVEVVRRGDFDEVRAAMEVGSASCSNRQETLITGCITILSFGAIRTSVIPGTSIALTVRGAVLTAFRDTTRARQSR